MKNIKVTLEESFAYGKLEGQKELLREISELLTDNITVEFISAYVRARMASLDSVSEITKALVGGVRE